MKTFFVNDIQNALGIIVPVGSSLVLTLSQNATNDSNPIPNTPITISLVDGSASESIWFNDELEPSGTFYNVQVVVPDLGTVWDQNISIVGASYNLASFVPLPCSPPSGAGNPVTGWIGNNAASLTGNPVPTYADYLGFDNSDGDLVGVSSSNPLPCTFTGSAGNAAASATGQTIPADADYIGFLSGGNLVGVSSGNPLPVSASLSIADPLPIFAASLPLPTNAAQETGGNLGYIVTNTNVLSNLTIGAHGLEVDGSGVTQPVSGTVEIGTSSGVFSKALNQDGSGNVGVNVENTVTVTATDLSTNIAEFGGSAVSLGQQVAGSSIPVILPSATITTLIPPSASAIASAIVSNPPTVPVTGTFYQATQPISGTVSTTPPSHASTNVDEIGGVSIALGQAVAGSSIPVVLPSAQITTLTPPTASAIGSAVGSEFMFDGSGYLEVNVKAGSSGGTQYTDDTAESSGAFTGTVAMGYDGADVWGLRLDTTTHYLQVDAKVLPAITVAASQTIAVTNAGTFATQDSNLSGCISANKVAVSGTITAEIEGHAGVALDAVLGATKPANVIQVGGNDGTNAYAIPLASGGGKVLVTADAITIASAQTLATLTSITDAVTVEGNVASGSPVSGANDPVLFAGSDGTDVRTVLTSNTGQLHTINDSGSTTAVTGVVEVGPTGAANTKTNAFFTEISDGTNTVTTNSTTYSSKYGLDVNLLGTLGSAFSTAGKVDVIASQGTAANLNATVSIASAQTLATVTTVGTVNAVTAITDTVTTTSVPGTSGGLSAWDIFGNTLTDSSQEVKSSAGQFYGYSFFNPNAVPVYLMIYSASETAGSATNRVFCVGFPAGAGGNFEISNGIACATTIYAAISTAVNSAAAPSTTCIGTLFYK